MADMAIELTAEVGPATLARFENLKKVDPKAAGEIAAALNTGKINVSEFAGRLTRRLAEFARIDRSSAASALYGRMRLFRTDPPKMAALFSTVRNTSTEALQGDARGPLVSMAEDGLREIFS